MNLNYLPVQDRLRQSATTSDRGTAAAAIKELFMLEACTNRCEALADMIASDPVHQRAMSDLSECIAACQTYLAAKSRESRYEMSLRACCADALAHAADSCKPLPQPEARACYKLIRACLQLIGPRHDCTAPSCN